MNWENDKSSGPRFSFSTTEDRSHTRSTIIGVHGDGTVLFLATIVVSIILPLFILKVAIPLLTFSPRTYMQSISKFAPASISTKKCSKNSGKSNDRGSSTTNVGAGRKHGTPHTLKESNKHQRASGVVVSTSHTTTSKKLGKQRAPTLKKDERKKGEVPVANATPASSRSADRSSKHSKKDRVVTHTHAGPGEEIENSMIATEHQEIEIRDAGHSIEITSSGSMSITDTPPREKRLEDLSEKGLVETKDDNDGTNVSPPRCGAKKTVFLIRHAESDENRRLMSFTRSLTTVAKLGFPAREDVMASVELLDVKAQLDSDVSDVGRRQIAQLARQLRAAKFVELSGIQLVAHSPLRRARQTSEGMLECVSPRAVLSYAAVKKGLNDESNMSDTEDSGASIEQFDSRDELMKCEVRDVTEAESRKNDGRDEMPLFVGNPCGSGPPQLNPKVALEQIRQMQAQRQRHGPHRTLRDTEYCSMGKKAPTVSRVVEVPSLMERTPMEWLNPTLLAKRIVEFEDWLAEQPESHIAVVGHSQYFKTMLGLTFKFQNCDVWELTFDPCHRRQGVDAVLQDGAGTNTTALQETLSKTEALSRLRQIQERNFFRLTSRVQSQEQQQSTSVTVENVGRSSNTLDVVDLKEEERSLETKASIIGDDPQSGRNGSETKVSTVDVDEVHDLPEGWSDLKRLYRFDPSDEAVDNL